MTNLEHNSDHNLIERLHSGEDSAAAELYFRYADRLFGLVRSQVSPVLNRRVEAEEIVQSVFRTFFRPVQPGQYEIPPGAELWRLLLVVALNKIRSSAEFHYAQRRDVRRTESIESQSHREFSTTSQSYQEAVVALKLVIDELLKHLPTIKRQMIELRIAGIQTGSELLTKTRWKVSLTCESRLLAYM